MANLSLMAALGLNISEFVHGMNAAQSKAASTGSKIGSDLSSHIGGKLAGIASIAGIEMAMQSAIEYAGHITDLSDRLDMSGESLQEWDYALKLTGSSVDAAVGFFEKLAVSRAKALKGDNDAIADFKALGVAVDDLKNKRIDDIARQISRVFETGDAQVLIDPLRSVGGKSAGEMVPAMRAGIDDASQSARDNGQIMDDASRERLDAFGDAVTTISNGIRNGIIAPLAGFLVWFGSGLSEVATYLTAMVVAPIEGAVRALKSFDPFSPWKSYKAIIASANESRDEAIDGLQAMKLRKEEQEEERRRKLTESRRLRLDSTESEAATKKASEEAKALRSVQEQLAAEERKGRLEAMNAEERKAALTEEMWMLREKADATDNPEKKARLLTDAQKIENQLAADARKAEKDSGNGDNLTSAQKAQNLIAAEAKRSEMVLRRAKLLADAQAVSDKLAEEARKQQSESGKNDLLTSDQKIKNQLAADARRVEMESKRDSLLGGVKSIDDQMAADAKNADKATGKDAKKPKLGSERAIVPDMQKIGGFLGAYVQAPEVAMLDVQKKSENHLQFIRKHFERMAATDPQPDIEY